MNGSDLESDFGLATSDLAEMLESGLHAKNANVLIFTGGAKRWQNDAIPANECVIWQLSNGRINELKSLGKVNMGEPETLRNFIVYGKENFPAEKYGLIMWDHGGGSIAGFGHDEKFNNSSLSLLDMKQAFEGAGLRDEKLEFLGFDACLMATVEMAVLASDYAHVLIAAEDLEPGEGWDYTFLSALNGRPRMDGFAMGKVIVDSFIDFFGDDSEEILTLSVTDLAYVTPIMAAMGALMEAALDEMSEISDQNSFYETFDRIDSGKSTYNNGGFYGLATRRANTKTFGEGSPRDNYADMVDIGDMATLMQDLFPVEAEAVHNALKKAVVYNRHNSDVNLWGLSTFYIYGGKSQGENSLEIYSGLGMDDYYTSYLQKFFAGLKLRTWDDVICEEYVLLMPVNEDVVRIVGLCAHGNDSMAQFGDEGISCATEIWPKINGYSVVLFPIATTANARKYAIPAEINNREVDIVLSLSDCGWKISGSRNRIENVYQKGLDPILPGDEIAIYYQEYDFSTNYETWVKGTTFSAPLSLTWEAAPEGYTIGKRRVDACTNVTYSCTSTVA